MNIYRANLKPFTGIDEEISSYNFRNIYKAIVSLARGAGENLSGFKCVFILENDHKVVCGIGNNDGWISVAHNDINNKIQSVCIHRREIQ